MTHKHTVRVMVRTRVLRALSSLHDMQPRATEMTPMAAVTRRRPRRARWLAAALTTEVVLDAGFAIGSWPQAACGRRACSRGVVRAAFSSRPRSLQPTLFSTRASRSAIARERQLAAELATEASPAQRSTTGRGACNQGGRPQWEGATPNQAWRGAERPEGGRACEDTHQLASGDARDPRRGGEQRLRLRKCLGMMSLDVLACAL